MAITQVDLPGVYGAAQRVRQGQQQNALLKMQMDQARQQAETQNKLRPLLGKAVQGDQQALGQVAQIDPDRYLSIKQNIDRMDSAERERMRNEAPIMARALQNATPQNWGMVRSGLQRFGVDVSDLPEMVDEGTIGALRHTAQLFMEPMDAPTVKTFYEGGQSVQKQWDPQVGDWVEVGRGDRFKGTPDVVVNNGPQGIDYGNPPKDMVWARNPDGSIATQQGPDGYLRPVAVPISGGPVETEQAAAEKAAAAAETSKERQASVVIQELDRGLQLVQESPLLTTSVGGAILQNVPGTAARDLNALLDTVRANAGFDKLQAMREASPTGGALGQVSNREIQLLTSAIGNLEQSQSGDQLADNMKRVKNIYLDIVHGEGNGPARETLSFERGGAQSGGDLPIAQMSAADLGMIDIRTLTREQQDALDKRLQELGY